MKKKILFLVTIIVFIMSSCTQPVLDPVDYEVIDTTHISTNGFNQELGYDVIVKMDSSFYYGSITKNGILWELDHKKIDLTIFE
jgi:hypothetical protein